MPLESYVAPKPVIDDVGKPSFACCDVEQGVDSEKENASQQAAVPLDSNVACAIVLNDVSL